MTAIVLSEFIMALPKVGEVLAAGVEVTLVREVEEPPTVNVFPLTVTLTFSECERPHSPVVSNVVK